MTNSVVKIKSMFQDTENVKMICPDCLGYCVECNTCGESGIVAVSDNYFYLEALKLASNARDSVCN